MNLPFKFRKVLIKSDKKKDNKKFFTQKKINIIIRFA